MSINNFNHIGKHLKWDNDDQFYYLQLLQRRKENPELPSNSRVIKEYYIGSREYLDKHEDEIIKLCDMFKARASLRLNKRSYKKIAFMTLKKLTDQLISSDFYAVRNSYSKACGTHNCESKKMWILDIDDRSLENEWDRNYLYKVEEFVNSIDPEPGTEKFLYAVPSKTGFHMICNPFRLDLFKKEYPEIEVLKDNPTNLYIP